MSVNKKNVYNCHGKKWAKMTAKNKRLIISWTEEINFIEIMEVVQYEQKCPHCVLL